MRKEGCIRTVVSDHSPCTRELKIFPRHLDCELSLPTPPSSSSSLSELQNRVRAVRNEKAEGGKGDFFSAWGGISSLGLGLPLLWTTSIASPYGVSEPRLSVLKIVELCAFNTAKQVGLQHRKGALKAGLDADICIFDDGEEWMLGRGMMSWKNKVSPYEGRELRGRVRETWVRGRKVWSLGGGFEEEKARGRCILERWTC